MSRPATSAPLLLLIALASVAMLGGALIAQHVFDWQPCTLCVQIRLWLSLTAIIALLLAGATAARQRWLVIILWPLLLAASGMALIDNGHVTAIELGIMDSFSCSPFPFYYQELPLHQYWPGVFMSGGVCGMNDYKILGLPFTVWTLASIAALFALVLFTLWRSIRGQR